MFGFDVSVLQFLLAKRGFRAPRITSGFGGTTETLVRRFQRKHGLIVDGVVGPATRGALLGTHQRQARAQPRATRASVRDSIARWAAHYGVDVHLARGLAWQESGFQNHVRSGVGATGVLQVMPPTWSFVELVVIGANVPHTTDGNVRVGIAYLAHLLREFHGNARLALGAYYQGPASVRRRGLFAETRHFVANVLALRGRV
jgi:peptidoglycan hydrolase-like protein with peptidoglycan-binding domain